MRSLPSRSLFALVALGAGCRARTPPVPPRGPAIVTEPVGRRLATDGNTCLALASGRVACWGDGDSGQLGNGATRDASRPVLVTGIDDALRVSVGGSLSCALRRGGRVACWGTGHGNRLGLGRGRRASEPVSIDGLSSVVQVVVGLLHACALRDDGVVLCWGGNPSGQCGVEPPGWGLGRSVFPPFAVAGLRDVVELAGEGSTHTCARRRDGHVLCWGHGARGELGNGALTSSHRPVEVVGISDAVEVASSDSTCVRTRGPRALLGLELLRRARPGVYERALRDARRDHRLRPPYAAHGRR